MDPQFQRHVVAERIFWAASALSALGGVGSVVAGAGHTNRLQGVIVPFLAAAAGFAVLALMHQRGRAFSTVVYVVTGLAIVYGLLLVLAVPLRLAVEGTCPPAPQRCTSGAELQLSNAETLALTIAVFFGALALLTGYFGLAALYRMRRPGAPAAGPAGLPAQEPAAWRRRAAKEAEAKVEPEAEEAKTAEGPKSGDETPPAAEAPPG